MQVNSVNSQSFTGKIGMNTLENFKKVVSPEEFKIIKKFRAGERNTLIDIVTLDTEPKRLPTGTMVMQKETFASIKNSRRKNQPPVLIKLADGKLPFKMRTFSMISEALVFKGEKILNNLRG